MKIDDEAEDNPKLDPNANVKEPEQWVSATIAIDSCASFLSKDAIRTSG